MKNFQKKFLFRCSEINKFYNDQLLLPIVIIKNERQQNFKFIEKKK